ncbi:hypothetical protein QL285_036679 [Trifolium repens]|nr:hypothetical protein QL285_036679 [Trifolium repens]
MNSGRKSANYQLVESEDDISLEENKIFDDYVHVQSQEIDNEDSQKINDNVDKEAVDTGKKDSEDSENITIETKLKTDNVIADNQTHREAETSDHLAVPCTIPDVGDIKKSKKKGKEKETKSSCNDHSAELDNAAQDEQKMNTAQDLLDQTIVDNVDKEAVDEPCSFSALCRPFAWP